MECFKLDTWDIGITVRTNNELFDIEGDKKTSKLDILSCTFTLLVFDTSIIV